MKDSVVNSVVLAQTWTELELDKNINRTEQE